MQDAIQQHVASLLAHGEPILKRTAWSEELVDRRSLPNAQ